MNTELLINAIVQQTMVFVARLATAGGTRAPWRTWQTKYLPS